jgi:small subunit ribosomal protein S11
VIDIAGDLEDIADQIDAANASGFDTVTLTPEANDEQPPRAPNSEEHAKSEELRKQSKKPRDAREDSPFAVKGLYRLSAQCSNNNTILTLGDYLGKTVYQVSSGMCGFKHVQRSTYEAGYQCAVRMFEKIEAEQKREGTVRLEIFFKGRGMGRDALQKALMMSEGDVVRKLVVQMTDRTAIKIGGEKAKKARRL